MFGRKRSSDKPHKNNGLITPYKGKPAFADLTSADQQKLDRGDTVEKTIQTTGGGRGVAVQLINAPMDKVWSKIKAFSSYPRWVDGVKECSIYKEEGSQVVVKFVISAFMIKKTYFIEHTFAEDEGYVTWTLDYSRLSDFDDSVGYWLVTEERPGVTRVEYSVDLRLSGVPKSLVGYLTKDALPAELTEQTYTPMQIDWTQFAQKEQAWCARWEKEVRMADGGDSE